MTYDEAFLIQQLKKRKIVTRSILADTIVRCLGHWSDALGLTDRKFRSWVEARIEVAEEFCKNNGINVVDISNQP